MRSPLSRRLLILVSKTFVADAVTQVFFTGRYYVLTGRRWFIAFTVIGITIEAISVSMMVRNLIQECFFLLLMLL